jgi:hypothetical protein
MVCVLALATRGVFVGINLFRTSKVICWIGRRSCPKVNNHDTAPPKDQVHTDTSEHTS